MFAGMIDAAMVQSQRHDNVRWKCRLCRSHAPDFVQDASRSLIHRHVSNINQDSRRQNMMLTVDATCTIGLDKVPYASQRLNVLLGAHERRGKPHRRITLPLSSEINADRDKISKWRQLIASQQRRKVSNNNYSIQLQR